ncbi:MAG: hypothetical protein SP1CHLAM54_08090 [Chlamydiia bacterium]|nr:hypothetical protein [Chlamydiia bacterium]MCH9615715.1 hypothetical protein [Chlamydiia bacterium]MCH9628882.1 hypothetical protein [Chlamydiia bacterium]
MKKFLNFILLSAFSSLIAIDTFSPELVRFVTENGTTGNMLFHGDVPSKANGKFNRKALINGLKGAYSGKFPKKYTLVILSHLTRETLEEENFMVQIYAHFTKQKANKVDIDDIDMQTEYSSSKGLWYWWQVKAHVAHTPPFDEDVSWEELETAYANLTTTDVQTVLLDQSFAGTQLNFVDCVDTLHELLTRDESKPLVIYVHSRRGFNRNGASLASYMMKYKSQTIESAWNRILEDPNLIYEQQELKSYLFYYKSYLELF